MSDANIFNALTHLAPCNCHLIHPDHKTPGLIPPNGRPHHYFTRVLSGEQIDIHVSYLCWATIYASRDAGGLHLPVNAAMSRQFQRGAALVQLVTSGGTVPKCEVTR